MTTAASPVPLIAFARDIKFSHSIFAMPFALLAMVLAANGRPALGQILLIIACMVIARSFAMGMNRLLDAQGDALNPRTARRAIPSGVLSRQAAIGIVVACALAFEVTAL